MKKAMTIEETLKNFLSGINEYLGRKKPIELVEVILLSLAFFALGMAFEIDILQQNIILEGILFAVFLFGFYLGTKDIGKRKLVIEKETKVK